MNDRVLIIGAGVAGLSAGCYARMNGLDAIVLERSDRSGGLCTSWKRGDYLIPGGQSQLTGSGPGSQFHRMWQELGVAGEVQFLDLDRYSRIEDEHGQSFTIYTDIERLREHMLSLSPTELTETDRLCDALTRCAETRGADTVTRPGGLRSILPGAGQWQSYHRITIGELASRFSHQLLRQGLYRFSSPLAPATDLLLTLAWLSRRAAAYPRGGPGAVVSALERRFRALGGEIHHRTEVAAVTAVGGRAVGVRTADGASATGDHIIAAGDGYDTLFRLLQGRYVGGGFRRLFPEQPVSPSVLLISLGVKDRLIEEPPTLAGVTFPPRRPLTVAGEPVDLLRVRFVNYDPAIVPTGCSLVQVIVPSGFEYWSELRSVPEQYGAAKQDIAGNVIAALDDRWRGLAGRIEMIDVATPATLFRYTNNWRGSTGGWIHTGGPRVSRTLPGLSGLYLAGHWTEPGGGVAAAAMTGRDAIRLLCRDQRRRFRTTTGARQEPVVQ